MSTTLTKNTTNNVNGLALELTEWKKFSVENTTNCYIYALNLPKNPYTNEYYKSWKHIQPGHLGGNAQISNTLYSPFDADEVISLVKKDLQAVGMELVESTYNEVREGKWWKVALVFDNDGLFGDYHWYRQNDDGTWSHKPGRTAVTNKDESDKIITNPETCDRGRYRTFVGFFMIRKKRGRKSNALKQLIEKIKKES